MVSVPALSRTRVAVGASAVSTVAFIASSGAAKADFHVTCDPNTAWSNGPCQHHDDSPEFWYSDTGNFALNQNWRDAANYGKGRLDLSDVDPVNVANPQSTGVAVFQGAYGATGWYGWTPCDDVNSDLKCRHSNSQFNNYYGPYTQAFREALTCHEFGHTVGLLHKSASGAGSCMENNSPGNYQRDYDSNDRGDLNSHYAP